MLAPWLIALAEAPKIESKPGSETEFQETWNELLTTFSLQPKIGEVPQICEQAKHLIGTLMELMAYGSPVSLNWLKSSPYDLNSAQRLGTSLLDDFSSLAERAEAIFDEMSFGFLYDSDRHVFHIGYNVESGRMDQNYYDLLASEFRIASLIAIARGDVPQEHWLHLSRPLTEVNGKRTLLSWSGTMFEYLMPTLLLESYPDTLLGQSCRAAVQQQISYATEKKIPWGISEIELLHFRCGPDLPIPGIRRTETGL